MSWEYKQCLSHHGIKGQKWGVRRYQNEDGTFTPEGKARYAKLSDRDKQLFNTYYNMSVGIEIQNQKFKQRLKEGDIPWWQSRKNLEKSIEINDKDAKDIRNQAYEILDRVKGVTTQDIQKHKTLSQRFDEASKDNPKLSYKQIYKEMKVDTRSDDPDVYKDAEDRWLRKHGY